MTDPSQPPPTSDAHQIKIRVLRKSDAPAVAAISEKLYASINSSWSESAFLRLLNAFPDGQIGVEDNGKIVAFAFALRIDYDRFGDDHSYDQITGNFSFDTQDPDGDVLYGIEVCVDPEYQGLRLGRRLYDARKETCEQLNLRAIIAGGRMPGYEEVKDEMSPREYIDKIRRKELYDPVLSFQLSNDFHVKKVLTNYLHYDTESQAFAALLEWNNIYFRRSKRRVLGRHTEVRLGIVQFLMRETKDLADFFDHVEFFIDAVSGYKADFVAFPEYVNAALMAPFNSEGVAGSIRKLASFTDEIRDFFIKKAVEYNINIISGSMPHYDGETLRNVVYLCRRDGTWEQQFKIHITPNEARDWGMVGGDELRSFDTDCGKIAMLICYDVEFPELGRHLAAQGTKILFVPFCTDTESGYHRVRYCCQARAIENECYVAIIGSVGNLPRVVNMDIQYAQSAVFSPSDFAFPNKAIVSEATSNTEITIIADIDIDNLKDLHTHGTVQNLKQRRTDLYEITWGGNVVEPAPGEEVNMPPTNRTPTG
ncbi:bifunctional GNAT family N-acetyltransferase/carbon-nitrogen hydrolase family protein [soil metagenome]